MEIVRRFLPGWLIESWYVFLLFLGLTGLFLLIPFRSPDTTMYPGDISTFYAPQKSVAQERGTHMLRNSILSDAVMIYTPRHELVWNHMQHGAWPTYNPFTFGGRPSGGNMFYVLLHLPGWLLGGVIGGFLINTLWHVALGAVFFYWLMRDWRVSRPAALIGAIVWLFGQHQVVWYMFPAHLHTQIWFPLVLLAFRRLFFSPHWRNFATFSLLLSFIWLLGYVQGVIYLLLMLGLYFWFLVWQNKRHDLQGIARAVGIFSAAVFIFFILAGHTALSTAQSIQSGIRGDQAGDHTPACEICTPTTFATSIAGFVNPLLLGDTVHAEYQGPKNIVEYGRYMGLLPFLLIAGALTLGVWKRESGFFIGVAVLSWLIMHGAPVVTHILYAVPVLNLGQATRLITLVLLSGAILTSLLFDPVFLAWKSTQKRWYVSRRFLGLMALLATVSLTFLSLATNTTPHQLRWFIQAFGMTGFVLGLYATLLGVIRWKLVPFSLGAFLLGSLLFLELAAMLGNFNTFSQPEDIFPQTELTEWLIQNSATSRILASDTIYIPNTSVVVGLEVLNGYSTNLSVEYRDWLAEHFSSLETTYNGVLSFPAESNLVTNQFAVQYVLSEQPTSDPALKLVATLSGVLIYENTTAWPRVWVAPDSACTPENCNPIWPEESLSSRVEITTHYIDGYSMNIATAESSWLILSERWDPNWLLTVNGDSIPLTEVSPAVMAAPIPAGEYTVELSRNTHKLRPQVRDLLPGRVTIEDYRSSGIQR